MCQHNTLCNLVYTPRDWEGRTPCAYGAKVKKMAHYKTTYRAQDAPEPHNGVSDVEYF